MEDAVRRNYSKGISIIKNEAGWKMVNVLLIWNHLQKNYLKVEI